MIEIVIG